jgi:hypothetical protein
MTVADQRFALVRLDLLTLPEVEALVAATDVTSLETIRREPSGRSPRKATQAREVATPVVDIDSVSIGRGKRAGELAPPDIAADDPGSGLAWFGFRGDPPAILSALPLGAVVAGPSGRLHTKADVHEVVRSGAWRVADLAV